MTRRRLRLLLPACLGLVGVAMLALWPFEAHRTHAMQPEGLELFTSPPIPVFAKSKGKPSAKTVRVQMLIPKGWKTDDVHVSTIGDEPSFIIYPRLDRPWWQLTWSAYQSRGSNDSILVYTFNASVEDAIESHPGDPWSKANRSTTYEGMGFTVVYCCNEPAHYRTTYRQICESFRVIK